MITRLLRDAYERLFVIDMTSFTQFVVYKQKMNYRNNFYCLELFYGKIRRSKETICNGLILRYLSGS